MLFDTTTLSLVQGRRAEQLLTELCQFATDMLLPVYFDEELRPTTNSNRCCIASTLALYGGKYLKHMRSICPDYPYWKDLGKDDVIPSWWTFLRLALIDRVRVMSRINQSSLFLYKLQRHRCLEGSK